MVLGRTVLNTLDKHSIILVSPSPKSPLLGLWSFVLWLVLKGSKETTSYFWGSFLWSSFLLGSTSKLPVLLASLSSIFLVQLVVSAHLLCAAQSSVQAVGQVTWSWLLLFRCFKGPNGQCCPFRNSCFKCLVQLASCSWGYLKVLSLSP